MSGYRAHKSNEGHRWSDLVGRPGERLCGICGRIEGPGGRTIRQAVAS